MAAEARSLHYEERDPAGQGLVVVMVAEKDQRRYHHQPFRQVLRRPVYISDLGDQARRGKVSQLRTKISSADSDLCSEPLDMLPAG